MKVNSFLFKCGEHTVLPVKQWIQFLYRDMGRNHMSCLSILLREGGGSAGPLIISLRLAIGRDFHEKYCSGNVVKGIWNLLTVLFLNR